MSFGVGPASVHVVMPLKVSVTESSVKFREFTGGAFHSRGRRASLLLDKGVHVEARVKFLKRAKALGHDTSDLPYLRGLVNFLLCRHKNDSRSPTEAEYAKAARDLGYWQITADEWHEQLTGSTTPRKAWMAGFEKKWRERHPGEPLPPNVFEWMKICKSSRFDVEIDTKGSGG